MDEELIEIFVFGSNMAGKHGKGAALHAKVHHGAEYGIGHGRTGNSYAIPTKDHQLKVLPLDKIKLYVEEFLMYAEKHPELQFRLTPIGCGLAGYAYTDIAPMFTNSPRNVIIPQEFMDVFHVMSATDGKPF